MFCKQNHKTYRMTISRSKMVVSIKGVKRVKHPGHF